MPGSVPLVTRTTLDELLVCPLPSVKVALFVFVTGGVTFLETIVETPSVITWPGATVPTLNVTVFVVVFRLNVPWLAVADCRISGLGIASTTTTLFAAIDPMLVTVSVK